MAIERISTQRALDLHLALQLGLSPASMRRRRTLALEFMVGSCVAMGLWIAYLAITLPVSYNAQQWKTAWVGFDILLLLVLAGAGYCGWRRLQAVIPFCLVAATLLVCDAWFDVTLDWGTGGVWLSIASAVLLELPLAAFFLSRVHRLISMTARLAWQRLDLKGNPPPLRRMPLFFVPGLNEAMLARHAEKATREVALTAGSTSATNPADPSADLTITAADAADMLAFFDTMDADVDTYSARAQRFAALLRNQLAAN